MFTGKDTRFALEENIGWTVLGQQYSGWLFKQTLALDEAGVILTYSGDVPFMMRLVTPFANDDVHSSRTALYVDPSSNFTATTVDEETQERLPAAIPFRKELPSQSLVFMRHVGQACPDITHMMIRLVEFDLRKMCQLLLETLHPYADSAVRALESNLSDRQIKEPSFEFNIERKGYYLYLTHQYLRF
jgi:hypothetical protein